MNASDRSNAILDKLERRAWYKATDRNLIALLTSLPPEKWNGFLDDLGDRPDVIGDLTVRRLVNLYIANYAVIAMFEVSQPAASAPYTYEYVSWRQGPLSGAKGIILIESSPSVEITHFVVLRGNKFAVGKEAFDVVGGFAEPNEEGVKGMMKRFETELKEELGAPEIKIKDIYDLGRILPDAGMTNNHPQIFAAVVDASNMARIGNLPNPDPWELSGIGPVILPIERLAETILADDDGFLHICVTRCIATGILPTSVLAPPRS